MVPPALSRILSVILLFSVVSLPVVVPAVPLPSGGRSDLFPFPHTEMPDIDFSVFPGWNPVDSDSRYTHYTPPRIGISEIPDYREPDVEITYSDYLNPELHISYIDYTPPKIGISEFPGYTTPEIGISALNRMNSQEYDIRNLIRFLE